MVIFDSQSAGRLHIYELERIVGRVLASFADKLGAALCVTIRRRSRIMGAQSQYRGTTLIPTHDTSQANSLRRTQNVFLSDRKVKLFMNLTDSVYCTLHNTR